MRRREVSKALFGSSTVVVAACAEPLLAASSVEGTRAFPITSAETKAGAAEIDSGVPSHNVLGTILPKRYGARYDGNHDDTEAHNTAFRVAQLSQCPVQLAGGVSKVTHLVFGSNSEKGMSRYPTVIRGCGVQTVLRAPPGTHGTVFSARGCSGAVLADFIVDCGGTAEVAFDFSWPGTVGPSVQNVYSNLWAQNFTQNGFLGINDNQSKYQDMVARGAITTLRLTSTTGNFRPGEAVTGTTSHATGNIVYWDSVSRTVYLTVAAAARQFIASETVIGQESGVRAGTGSVANGASLSGVRVEGSGGAIFLDNITVADSFLSVTCQNAEIHGGFSFGLRINESQTGLNFLSFSGGTQIYSNPSTLSHFEDAHAGAPGHYISSLTANGLYLISSDGPQPTNTINCAIATKAHFQECVFVQGPGATGPWNLYGARARSANQPHPAVVALDGCNIGAMATAAPAGLITQRRDLNSTDGLVSDFPTRVVFRNTLNLPTGLAPDTFTEVVPRSALAEEHAVLLVCVAASSAGGATFTGTSLFTGLVQTPTSGKIEMRLNGGLEVATSVSLAPRSTLKVTVLRLANATSDY